MGWRARVNGFAITSLRHRMGSLYRHIRKVARPLRPLVEWVYQRKTILVFEMGLGDLCEVPARADYSFGRAPDPGAGPHVETMRKVGFHNPEEHRRAVEIGDTCYTATIDGKVAGFCWLTTRERRMPEIGVVEAIGPDIPWIYTCAVDPVFRGLRIYPSMLSRICAEQFAAGARRVRIDVDQRNLASIRGIEMAGFQRAGRYEWGRLWGRVRVRWIHGPVRVAVSRGRLPAG